MCTHGVREGYSGATSPPPGLEETWTTAILYAALIRLVGLKKEKRIHVEQPERG